MDEPSSQIPGPAPERRPKVIVDPVSQRVADSTALLHFEGLGLDPELEARHFAKTGREMPQKRRWWRRRRRA